MCKIDIEGYPWIELAAIAPRGGMVRNRYVELGDAEMISEWVKDFHNRDVFASVARFERPDRTGPYLCDFFLDIDCEGDVEDARRQTLGALDLMRDRIGISPESIDIAFSGAKGFHVIVGLDVFGSPQARGLMPLWKAVANRLHQGGIEHIDLGVYQPARVLRLANSINSKTSLFKIPIEYKELRDLTAAEIAEMAKEPRGENSLRCPGESDQAAAWFRKAHEAFQKRRPQKNTRKWRGFKKGWRVPPCIRGLEEAVIPDGMRHAAYLALARFYAWIGMHPLEAGARITQIDQRHPIRDPDYIDRIVDSAHLHPGFPGCDNPALSAHCQASKCFRARRSGVQGELRFAKPKGKRT